MPLDKIATEKLRNILEAGLKSLSDTSRKDAQNIQTNDIQLIKAYLAVGAAINTNFKGFTALKYAACMKQGKDLVQYLIDKGAKPDNNPGDISALMHAAIKGNVENIEVLVKNGAKIDVVNNFGFTALMCACKAGQGKAVQTLIDLTSKSRKDLRINHEVIFNADRENEKNSRYSALVYAMYNCSTDIVKLLLKSGASIRVFDNDASKLAKAYVSAQDIKRPNRARTIKNVLTIMEDKYGPNALLRETLFDTEKLRQHLNSKVSSYELKRALIASNYLNGICKKSEVAVPKNYTDFNATLAKELNKRPIMPLIHSYVEQTTDNIRSLKEYFVPQKIFLTKEKKPTQP